jgi:hypothetical protein
MTPDDILPTSSCRPFISIYDIFQSLVLKPNDALPVLTKDGYASPPAIRLKVARDVIFADAPDWHGCRPPIFDERVFLRDGFWEPDSARCKWTEQENNFLNSVDLMVRDVFENPSFAIIGTKEPKGHRIEWDRIDPGYWIEKIKVDFREQLLWTFDISAGQWRLMFSSLLIIRADFYRANSRSLGGLFPHIDEIEQIDCDVGTFGVSRNIENYKTRARGAENKKALVEIYLKEYGHDCSNLAEFLKRCTEEERPVLEETTRRYMRKYFSDLRPSHWPKVRSRS